MVAKRSSLSSLAWFPPGRASSDGTVDAGLRPEAVEAGRHVGCFGPFDLRAQTVVPSAEDRHAEGTSALGVALSGVIDRIDFGVPDLSRLRRLVCALRAR